MLEDILYDVSKLYTEFVMEMITLLTRVSGSGGGCSLNWLLSSSITNRRRLNALRVES
jgi:hypothetical protein